MINIYCINLCTCIFHNCCNQHSLNITKYYALGYKFLFMFSVILGQGGGRSWSLPYLAPP